MAVYSKDTNLLLSEIDELFEKADGSVNQLNKGKGGEVYIFEEWSAYMLQCFVHLLLMFLYLVGIVIYNLGLCLGTVIYYL